MSKYHPRAGEAVRIDPMGPPIAMMPKPLCPTFDIMYSARLSRQLADANAALGKLNGLSRTIKDPARFQYVFLRQEAVLSAQIEGTQSTLADLLQHESGEVPGQPIEDIEEVVNYLGAMAIAMSLLPEPFSVGGLESVHARLLRGVRGADKAPGQIRRAQNWIGGRSPDVARYVPPPARMLPEAMADLIAFLNQGAGEHNTLIRAGVAHAQFESIHPFLDGNGRLGRLLIAWLLAKEGALPQPLLYVSHYLKANQREYYDWLLRIRTEGDWEGWLLFFLEGVEEVALAASQMALDLADITQSHRTQLLETAPSTRQVFDALEAAVFLSPATAAAFTGRSIPTVLNALRELEALGIAHETTGRKRGRVYVYKAFMDRLNAPLQRTSPYETQHD
jgi:Fic family protein